MENKWLQEALFAGMTSNSFKLGTVLGLGWFWYRSGGCCILYRGESPEQIEFGNILAAAESDARTISPPDYVSHEARRCYYYLLRRVNGCGFEELSFAGAVKVCIGADGDLAGKKPNSVFAAASKQKDGDKVRLVWFYHSLEQGTEPACFKVYFDSGTGQIDFENPVAQIAYAGRGFYRFESSSLESGRYLFAVRAESGLGEGDGSLEDLEIELDTNEPAEVEIVSVQAV